MAKNYRAAVDKLLDLADPNDPVELAQYCENAAATLRHAATLRDETRETRRLMSAVGPWFDPTHPMNTP